VDSSRIVVSYTSRSECYTIRCGSCAQPTFCARTERHSRRDVSSIAVKLRRSLCFLLTVLQDCCLIWTASYILVFCSRQNYWDPFMSTAVNNSVLFSSYKDSWSVKLDSALMFQTRNSLLSFCTPYNLASSLQEADLNMFLCLTELQNIWLVRRFC